MTVTGVTVLGQRSPQFNEILTDDALRFLAALHRTFDNTRKSLLTARIAVHAPTPACGVWRRPGPDGSVIKGGPDAGEGDGEEAGQMQVAEERYVALRCDAWVRDLGSWRDKRAGAQPGLDVDLDVGGEGDGEGGDGRKEELVLIPYYLRANRGGKGHMRVGMLRK